MTGGLLLRGRGDMAVSRPGHNSFSSRLHASTGLHLVYILLIAHYHIITLHTVTQSHANNIPTSSIKSKPLNFQTFSPLCSAVNLQLSEP